MRIPCALTRQSDTFPDESSRLVILSSRESATSGPVCLRRLIARRLLMRPFLLPSSLRPGRDSSFSSAGKSGWKNRAFSRLRAFRKFASPPLISGSLGKSLKTLNVEECLKTWRFYVSLFLSYQIEYQISDNHRRCRPLCTASCVRFGGKFL